LSTVVDDIQQVATRANELLGQIGTKRRERTQKEKDLNDEVQKSRDEHGPAIDELKKEERSLIRELTELVLPRFALLARSGTKTISLRNGEIKLHRSSRDALNIAEGETEENIIKRIRRLRGVRRFIRVKIIYELDREKLKAAPEFVAKVKGLAIARKTFLRIRPSEVQGEEIKDNDMLNVPVASED
jgi:phage host-nuclease inhibitor protein Gam